MADKFLDENVRTRLLLSGISEIEACGVKDFSMRRAALLAGVSCAAPYRYFKGKEDYVAAILSYLYDRWSLLLSEIERVFGFNKRTFVLEALSAYVKFWLANENLFLALLSNGAKIDGGGLLMFDGALFSKVGDYLKEKSKSAEDLELKLESTRASLYGFLTLIGSGEHGRSGEDLEKIKRSFEIFI